MVRKDEGVVFNLLDLDRSPFLVEEPLPDRADVFVHERMVGGIGVLGAFLSPRVLVREPAVVMVAKMEELLDRLAVGTSAAGEDPVPDLGGVL